MVCAGILNDHNLHSADFKALALGPLDHATRFTAYNVNGFKFCTVSRDQGLLTQNMGVYGTFGIKSYMSSNDCNMQFNDVLCYGKLLVIVKINYQGRFRVTLFKCLWANTTTSQGITIDDLRHHISKFLQDNSHQSVSR